MVEVLQYIPSYLLNLVAGINHVHSFIHGVFYLDGEYTGVAVQVLCFALEAVKTVGIL